MKRILVICTLAALAVLGASVAEAAIKKGKFTGDTDANDPLGLKVGKTGKIHSFYYEGVTLRCTDGDQLDTPTGRDRIQTPRSIKFRVTSDRRWGIRARNDSTGFGWDAEGRFNAKGTRVTGTLSVFATFNERNEQDPNGSVRCESGELDFSAKRG